MINSEQLLFLIADFQNTIIKIICFILGYLIVRLGYQLIASGAKGEFKFSAKLGGVKADIASISPGLLFVLLGVFLICYAIYVPKTTTYVNRGQMTQPAPNPTPPGHPFPSDTNIKR